MKKKLLFVIPNLDAGGAEKSLVNLLNTIDNNLFEIDLLLFSKTGLFLPQVPDFVNVLDMNFEYKIFQKTLHKSVWNFLSKGKWRLVKARILFFLELRKTKNSAIAEQNSWKYISQSIKQPQKKYDAAIAYLEKSSIYFIVDFIVAKKKIGWIHNDYEKLGLYFNFDEIYFKKLNSIVTVSEECQKVLENKLPEEKIHVIYNISSPKLIYQLANRGTIEKLPYLALLSIGRLHPQKGFDLAIEAAKIIKEKYPNFLWQIIGEGSERANLEKLIAKCGLEENFKLLGLNENPYPYLKNCDVYVQPSRYEGKSIAIDEALIMQKLIVATNFSTVRDQISNYENGLIAEMEAQSLAEKILELLHNKNIQNKIITNLQTKNFGNENEISKLYCLFDE